MFRVRCPSLWPLHQFKLWLPIWLLRKKCRWRMHRYPLRCAPYIYPYIAIHIYIYIYIYILID